ncbi:hypothetical protein CR513_46468, partial [Mucuna pruriens]
MDETVVVQPKKTKEHERQYPPECIMKMNRFIPPEPDIELTLRRLRKGRSIVVSTNSSSTSSSNSNNSVSAANNIDFSSYSSSNNNTYSNLDLTDSNKLELIENQDHTLKELAMPDVLEPTQSYELKSGLIHLLPKFHSLSGKDPHKHMKKFHVVVRDTRRLHQDEGIFTFSRRSSKGLVVPTTNSFQHLERHEMHLLGEVLPNLLIQYFYEGLMMMDHSMIDAASGGALMDKTPKATRHLISNMASNTQQFGTRGAS